MAGPSHKKQQSEIGSRLIPLIIFLIVVVVFRGATQNGFVDWDDNAFVSKNLFIRSFSPENIWEMFANFHTGNWHPITWLSHALDYRPFGLNPAGHHLTGIIFHGFNAVWIYFIFLRLGSMGEPRWQGGRALHFGALFAALLYACHPLRVESVVWASERKDLLSAFFMFPAVLTYLSFIRAKDFRLRMRWRSCTIVFFALALMSKPMVVTFPVILLILDFFPLKRLVDLKSFFRLIWEKLPFFLLSLVFGLITILTQKVSGAVVPLGNLSLDARLLNAVRASMFYIEKTLWPYPLVSLYPYPKGLSLGNPFILANVLAFLALLWWCLLMWRKGKPVWLASWMYYIVTVLPVIGVIQVGGQGAADRYTYLPTLSFYFLLGLGVVKILTRYSGAIMARKIFLTVMIAGGLALGVLAVLTDKQVRIWKDTETMWSWAVKIYPNEVALPHLILGRDYLKRGLREKAKEKYFLARRISPSYASPLNDLGLMALDEGGIDKAEVYFRKGIDIKPDAVFHTNLGLVYFSKNQFQKAKEQYLIALEFDPAYSKAHNNLGMIFQREGKLIQAENHYKKAIEVDPDFMEAFANLGLLYKNYRILPWAELALLEALRRNPENPILNNAMGEVYFMAGLFDLAKSKFDDALKVHPGFSPALRNLENLESLRKQS